VGRFCAKSRSTGKKKVGSNALEDIYQPQQICVLAYQWGLPVGGPTMTMCNYCAEMAVLNVGHLAPLRVWEHCPEMPRSVARIRILNAP